MAEVSTTIEDELTPEPKTNEAADRSFHTRFLRLSRSDSESNAKSLWSRRHFPASLKAIISYGSTIRIGIEEVRPSLQQSLTRTALSGRGIEASLDAI